ncbi:glycosyltransferase family 2 protein [Rufibacter immobilis]|uniref:glycosyltransferase family 2 protein n=1 Tax=Rufibacter immobilis TaxID=1348778 RepID=UPI0035E675A1
MPVYNASEFLRAAIQSLLNQTYPNWELIAVDDGSTDNSWDILKSYTDPRIKIYQRPNGGQSAATNTGLDYAKGEYIQFFDADDLMDSRKIEIQINAIREHGEDTIAVAKWAFFKDNIQDATFKDEPVYYSADAIHWLQSLWLFETMMPNHGYFIPRKVMEKAGKYYDETIKLNIDFEYFTRMVINATKVVYCPESVCYYRKGIKASKTYKPNLDKRLSALGARVKGIKDLFEVDRSERSLEAARMALTIVTYAFPEILPYSRKAIKDLGLERFASFGGQKFLFLSKTLGFSNAVRVKKLLKI